MAIALCTWSRYRNNRTRIQNTVTKLSHQRCVHYYKNNPESNAVCERMHQTVGNVLRTLLHGIPPQNIATTEQYVNGSLSIACYKPPRKVSYKCIFGMSNQCQMLDVWESQTAESALRWLARYVPPRHNLELTLEVILKLVLGIKTMTLVFNPGSHSKSLSLPRN